MTPSEDKRQTEELRKQAINLHVGRRIRLRREEVGLSRADLAVLLRVTTQQVAKYEKWQQHLEGRPPVRRCPGPAG